MKIERIPKGPLRALRALQYSKAGLLAAWQHEEAFRQEVLLAAALLPLGLWLGHNGVERALLCAPVLLVVIVELINSAIEAVVDRHGPEYHLLAGRAKDLGSAAVLITLLLTALTWGLVLLG